MKYSSIIRQLLNQFTDTSFWQLTRYAQELQDYRGMLIGQWDDNASRDINGQYLNPHAEDEAVMRGLLEKKQLTIGQLCEKLDTIEQVNNQIKALSEEIHKLLIHCEEDLRKAVTNYDFSLNRKNDAEVKIPQTIALLNTANQNEFSPTY